MENLNAEQIKGDLECCAYGDCKDCTEYSNDSCGTKVLGGALELIKSQEQRIKELTEDNEYLKTQLTATEARYESRKESDIAEMLELRLNVEELTEENERLRCIIFKENERTKTASKDLVEIRNGVENLIKENERLKAAKKELINAFEKLSEENEKLLNHYFIDTTVGSGTSRQKCVEETVRKFAERLTQRTENGGVKFSNGEYWNTVYPQNENCLTDIHRMAIKLCDLEDKIEQGKILELPCAVGTSVWFVTCVCDEIGKEKYDALEGEVISFSMQKYELWVYCHYKCGLTYWHTIDGFKADVFLAPEEANKKLKELENEQR